MSLRRIECHAGQFVSSVHDRTFVPLARINLARERNLVRDVESGDIPHGKFFSGDHPIYAVSRPS
jgi:hypothetical protein